jgi:hypothetical protein
MSSPTFSVKDVAERYGVEVHTVLAWIKSGELAPAVNVSRKINSRKPRWRITQQALDDFEALRASTPPPPKLQRRKRAEKADVIEFY